VLPRLERLVARSGRHVTPRLSISPARRQGTRQLPTKRLIALLGRVRNAPGAEALQVSALLDLLFVDSAGSYALRAVKQLGLAVEMSPESPSLLSDLAAAYLVRAERGGTLLDLQQAVEACERALVLEPGHQAALFNLALALELMMLDGEAAGVWEQVEAGPPTEWTREAARRRQALTARRPSWRRSPDSLASDAHMAPQEARLFAMDTLLRWWGDAVLASDSARAAANLRQAETIGESLRRRGGDLGVADLVQAIRVQAQDPAATVRLARAHGVYARGQARLAERKPGAVASFDSVLASGGRSPVLALWSRYFRGVAMFVSRDPATQAVFDSLSIQADPVRHPALAGRVRWSQGTLLLRAREYPRARDRFNEAGRFFTRAGESENLGAVRELEGEALFGLNDELGAYDRMWSALRLLRPYRASTWLHNLLFATSQASTARGLNHAAFRLREEGVRVASRQRPLVYVEALLARSRTLAAAGLYAPAQRDIAASDSILAAVDSGFPRDWQKQHLRLAEAGLWVQSDPRRAVERLDSVVDFFRKPGGVPSLVMAALVSRAEAHLALRDPAAAVAALDSAAALVDGLTAKLADASDRAMVLEKGRRVYDQLVMLHVRAGRSSEALAALERGRGTFGTASTTGVPRAVSAPAGEVVLDYALIGDTLLTFAVRGHRVWMVEDTVDRGALLGAAGRAVSALELRAPLDSILPPLAVLHRHLIAPVAARVPSGTPLIVIADDELGDVPFAALWDAARGRYLVQDHPLRFAASLADAQRRAPPRADPAASAVFVVDPAFDAAEHPGLQRLPQTADAVRQLGHRYPGARVLSDGDAGADSVGAALRSAGLFHFAGHAVFDPDRPAASFLVLAPGRGAAGRLTAADLERLDLRRVRLVVLSACQTQRSATGRAGGFAGLSGAILAAGAAGVVGSLWRVNDGLTRTLMDEFHRDYRVSRDAAGALRSAQLRLLSSTDPALRSPAAWAGFRYMGG
jgi:tetratricopeptide (TPR) repeat protein